MAQHEKATADKPGRGGRVAVLPRIIEQTSPEATISEEGAVTEPITGPVQFGTSFPEGNIALTKKVL